MNNEKAFEIVTNAMGRRVLVIRQYTEEIEKLKYEDSDIVFFDVVGLPSNEKRLLLQVTSPMLTKSYWLKPRFSKTPEQKIMGYIQNLVDGFANSPLDDMVTNKAEEILQRTAELRIEPMLEGLSTEVTFYISLCKYALSRGMTRLNSTIVPSLTLGITAVYAGMMSNAEITYREDQKFRRSELIEFNHRLLELDYTEYVRHVERIHLCPNCQSSHLIFAECCPKCESSHILQEPMIHHFRCANVSPESTYSYDGELRCPKCRHRLRHIGVDYDRPTDTYSCQECGHTFLHSEMKVLCADCGQIHKTESLIPYDIEEFEFTKEGIEAICNNKALITLNKDLWSGYSDFSSYLTQLRLFALTEAQGGILGTLRFQIATETSSLSEVQRTLIAQRLHELFPHFNLSNQGENFYLSFRMDEDTEKFQTAIEQQIRGQLEQLQTEWPSVKMSEFTVFIQEEDENIETYIQRLTRIEM